MNPNRSSATRRKFLSLAGTSMALPLFSGQASADEPNWTYQSSDSYDYSDEKGALSTFVEVYDGVMLPSYDYYTIPIKVSSNVATYWKSYSGEWLGGENINWSEFSVTWPDKYDGYKEVDAEYTEAHIGAYDEAHQNNYDYWDVAGDTVSAGINQLAAMTPIVGELMAAETVVNEFTTALGKLQSDPDVSWDVRFDWANPDNISETHYWNKVDVQLFPDDDIIIDIRDQIGSNPGLTNQFGLYVGPAGGSSSSLQTASETNTGIKEYTGADVKQNPEKFGLDKKKVSGIGSSESVYTVPVEVKVVENQE